jgi:hypothetical protein
MYNVRFWLETFQTINVVFRLALRGSAALGMPMDQFLGLKMEFAT